MRLPVDSWASTLIFPFPEHVVRGEDGSVMRIHGYRLAVKGVCAAGGDVPVLMFPQACSDEELELSVW